ncbi:hypothetical protein, partial [uncultured Tateyamaria sp.]|uniref:hypothetical protein n=1 Tax=uncultured Tateyamaria sp. TaxID=455651 RepID=UPI002634593E
MDRTIKPWDQTPKLICTGGARKGCRIFSVWRESQRRVFATRRFLDEEFRSLRHSIVSHQGSDQSSRRTKVLDAPGVQTQCNPLRKSENRVEADLYVRQANGGKCPHLEGLVLPHFSGQFQKILLTSLRSQPDLR